MSQLIHSRLNPDNVPNKCPKCTTPLKVDGFLIEDNLEIDRDIQFEVTNLCCVQCGRSVDTLGY